MKYEIKLESLGSASPALEQPAAIDERPEQKQPLPRKPLRARLNESEAAKRAMDVVGSLFLIFFFLPVLLLISVVLFVLYGGPVLFSHPRAGRNGETFGCLKFRTMHNDADAVLARCLENDPERRREWNETQKLKRDPRVHTVGRILRKSSLDELPQLFNVLAGQMSLVGPRPIIDAEAYHYGPYLPTYFALQPGITGLWQVSGRNNTTYAERVDYDVTYANRRTITGDVRILMRTARVVLTGYGAY